MHPDDREEVEASLRALLHNDAAHEVEYRLVLDDDRFKNIRERAVRRTDVRSTEQAFVGTLADVTDTLEAEEQLRRSQRLDAVSRLAGGIAHDFNNPLGIIVGNLDILALEELEGKSEQLVERALEAAVRGAELSRQMLNLARRDAYFVQAVDVNELVRGLRGRIEQAAHPGTTITYQCEPETWPTDVDPDELASAIINLVLNACDAIEREGGQLVIETRNRPASSGVLDEKYPLHVFSDVVMRGGMNGFQLASAIERARPDVHVVLASGFTAAAADARDPEALRRLLLNKPSGRGELLQAIRAELDSRIEHAGVQ